MPRQCTPQDLLHKVRVVSSKMVEHHDCEHLAASVLHELCDPNCFPVGRIAFFVDNPDFDCLKGIAGVVADNRLESGSVWDERERFSHHLACHDFHQQVRSLLWGSISRRGRSWDDAARELAEHVALEDPSWHGFSVKHGNRGVLLYEVYPGAEVEPNYLGAAAALLGMCPVV